MDTYYDASRDIHVDYSINRHKCIHHIHVPIRNDSYRRYKCTKRDR